MDQGHFRITKFIPTYRMNHVNLYALSFSSSYLSLPFIPPPTIDTSARPSSPRPSPPEEQLSSQQKSESGEVEDGGGYEHETEAQDSGGQERVQISQRKRSELHQHPPS